MIICVHDVQAVAVAYLGMRSQVHVILHFSSRMESRKLAMRQAPASQRKSRPLKRARPDSGAASGSNSAGEDVEEDDNSPLVIGPSVNECLVQVQCERSSQ